MAASEGATLDESDAAARTGKPAGDWKKGAALALVAVVALAGAAVWRLADGNLASLFASAEEPVASTGDAELDSLLAATQASPDSAEAWQRLAFAYFARNLFAQAAEAYDKAASIAPESAVLWSSLGEARVMASESDPMPAPALAAFRRALELDAKDPRARYFMAVNKDLGGDHEGAIADWLALLADTPPGAPWETDLVRTIQQVGQREGTDLQPRIDTALAARADLPQGPAALPGAPPAMAGIPGPTQEQLAAASSIPPSQQQDMAEAMVARLATRLESNPQNVDGWIMLMRSYRQLGRDEQARSAYARALQANPGAAEQLRAAAETLGLQ
ncbi:tetratricopeptide repeat protein [Alteraurantiacibacter buctensis]|uniref:Tetratricopeptide repeat protein n=1 Tax=Alteraurantiacibacter buctensis TaxID=1503981 RepID=A0A844Z323_9SPHN|nr:tetratricopeptide repeat protein [Alteraurantiacibacter buctensis]MXO73530.1 tetratricopeptide repeat protein [Alteraurantiacibacter buctensis]